VRLYPCLSRPVATRWSGELSRLSGAELEERVVALRADCVVVGQQARGPIYFSPSGGVRASNKEVAALSSAIFSVADRFGFHAGVFGKRVALPGRAARRQFDDALSQTLWEQLDTCPSEAADPLMWAWMGCVLAPEVVRWRFDGEEVDPSRYGASRSRNLFARSWWRAHILHVEGSANPWRLLAGLGEDEQVQLTERTRLSQNHMLVQGIVGIFLDTTDTRPDLKRAELWREIMKRLNRLHGIVNYECLDPADMAPGLRELADAVIGALGGELQRRPRRTAARNPESILLVQRDETLPLPLPVRAPFLSAKEPGSRADVPAPPSPGSRSGRSITERDPISALEPPSLLTKALAELRIRTVRDLVRLDDEAVYQMTGVGPVRRRELAALKAVAQRRIAWTRFQSLPVRATAGKLRAARGEWRKGGVEAQSATERLRRVATILGAAGHALPPDPARRGRPTTLQLHIENLEGPIVDFWETLDNALAGESSAEERLTTRARKIAALEYARAWNAVSDRPSLVVVDTRTGDEIHSDVDAGNEE